MRKATHEDVIADLEKRGENLEWVDNDMIIDDSFKNIYGESPESYLILDYVEVEGQVTDGIWENSKESLDFKLLLTKFDGAIKGRMLYYMKSYFGLSYNEEDLIDDLERLAEQYGAKMS